MGKLVRKMCTTRAVINRKVYCCPFYLNKDLNREEKNGKNKSKQERIGKFVW